MTDKSFLGLPVEGEIVYYSENPVEQYPVEQLQSVFKAVLDDPEVVKFGWMQYTPYFNDGDACVFHAYGTWVLTKDKVDTEEEDEWGLDYYEHEVRSYAYGDRHASPQHHQDLAAAIEGGHFYNVLLEAFGDPAEVTVSRAGIKVEYYSHD